MHGRHAGTVLVHGVATYNFTMLARVCSIAGLYCARRARRPELGELGSPMNAAAAKSTDPSLQVEPLGCERAVGWARGEAVREWAERGLKGARRGADCAAGPSARADAADARAAGAGAAGATHERRSSSCRGPALSPS